MTYLRTVRRMPTSMPSHPWTLSNRKEKKNHLLCNAIKNLLFSILWWSWSSGTFSSSSSGVPFVESFLLQRRYSSLPLTRGFLQSYPSTSPHHPFHRLHRQQQHQHQQRYRRSHSSSSSLLFFSTTPTTSFLYDSTFRPGNTTGFHTALAIVPPLEDWDRLQRARHYARDPLFHNWPPAIRLFHPLPTTTTTPTTTSSTGKGGTSPSHSNFALEVAQVIEELDLEPFTLTLDTWVIVPHLEAIEATYQTSQKIQQEQLHDGPSEQEKEEWGQNEAIRTLIEREEKIGQEKAKARAQRGAQKRKVDHDDNHDADDDASADDEEDSTMSSRSSSSSSSASSSSDDPFSQYQEQQQSLQDFGGPCILCLEPDMESKQFLQDIREELAMLLLHGGEDYFSPSSCFSPRFIEESIFQPSEYRPLIPIGSFESLPAAMEVARRLKGLWGEPLTFDVKELCIISNRDDSDMTSGQILDPIRDVMNREALFSSNNRDEVSWGCNAKVMLMGEEFDDDDEDEEDLALKMEQLCEEGQVGGNDISNDYTILDDEEEMSDLEMWLNNDEDYDEGITVTIGRTRFFTGDQRLFHGMPASSVVDGKDRSMGDVGSVSGLARRRRSVTRAGTVSWEEGEYGRRQTDYLPWSKREKPKRVERLLDLPSTGFTNRANTDKDSHDDMDDYHDDDDF